MNEQGFKGWFPNPPVLVNGNIYTRRPTRSRIVIKNVIKYGKFDQDLSVSKTCPRNLVELSNLRKFAIHLSIVEAKMLFSN